VKKVCTDIKSNLWANSPAHPVLSENEVHIWRVSLDQPCADHAALLSVDEQGRAQRFVFEKDRRRFIVARGTLRMILGRYLNLAPEKVQFEYLAHGKPVLTAGTLRFNLSHSEEIGLYAIVSNREVGIDLEFVRPVPDAEKLAEQFFSSVEKAELDGLPPSKKLASFFSGWTRKEAYIKARGDGMAYPLDQFSVSMDCERPARLLAVEDAPQEAARWSLYDINPAPGYIGALAIEDHDWNLVCWQFE
jgi:4'-phosphopantetheinyl transferase